MGLKLLCSELAHVDVYLTCQVFILLMLCLICMDGHYFFYFLTYALCIIFHIVLYLPTVNAHSVSLSLFNYNYDVFRHLSMPSSGSS
jgi:hypothetical protein